MVVVQIICVFSDFTYIHVNIYMWTRVYFFVVFVLAFTCICMHNMCSNTYKQEFPEVGVPTPPEKVLFLNRVPSDRPRGHHTSGTRTAGGLRSAECSEISKMQRRAVERS